MQTCTNCNLRIARTMSEFCEPCHNAIQAKELSDNMDNLGKATSNAVKAFAESDAPLDVKLYLSLSFVISMILFWLISDLGFFAKLAISIIGSPLFLLPGMLLYKLTSKKTESED